MIYSEAIPTIRNIHKKLFNLISISLQRIIRVGNNCFFSQLDLINSHFHISSEFLEGCTKKQKVDDFTRKKLAL